jgi:CMP-N-acetylneuraminic acid synthetase
MIKKITNQNSKDSLMTVSKVTDCSHPDFLVTKKNNRYKFKKSASEFSRHQLSSCFQISGNFIITKYDNFKKFQKMIDLRNRNIYYEIEDQTELLDINTDLDLKFANSL